jgi:hypothetical protein
VCAEELPLEPLKLLPGVAVGSLRRHCNVRPRAGELTLPRGSPSFVVGS